MGATLPQGALEGMSDQMEKIAGCTERSGRRNIGRTIAARKPRFLGPSRRQRVMCDCMLVYIPCRPCEPYGHALAPP